MKIFEKKHQKEWKTTSFWKYTSSLFQDFEGNLRKEVDLVEDDIRLV